MSTDEQAPTTSSPDSSNNNKFAHIDFSKPEACQELKEEHDRCFHSWLARFVKGEVKTDECKESWARYQECTREKLKFHGLAHLQTEWKQPSWEDLDTIHRKRSS